LRLWTGVKAGSRIDIVPLSPVPFVLIDPGGFEDARYKARVNVATTMRIWDANLQRSTLHKRMTLARKGASESRNSKPPD